MDGVIFLDIDGVLNGVRTVIAHHNQHKRPDSSMDRHSDELDPVAVHLLRQLCHAADASIVISSSWRILYKDPSYFIQFFADHNWPDAPVIGLTPVLDTLRGDEVLTYMNHHPEITRYVILDDDSDFLYDQPLVHVNSSDGFLLKHFLQALQILSPKHKMVTDLAAYLH